MGGYKLTWDEQFTIFFIFWLSFIKFCSLSIWRIGIMAKNKGKLSTFQLILVKHEKIVDPFFLNQMGWIKPKTISGNTVPLMKRAVLYIP
jgi:hypothetical protein